MNEIKIPTHKISPVLLPKNSDRCCLHDGAVDVDEQERIVRCKKCDAVIDPFDFLLAIARKENNAISRSYELIRECEQLSKQVIQLNSQIFRLKEEKKLLK